MRPLFPWLTLSLVLLAVGGAWLGALRSGARSLPVPAPPPPSSTPQLLPAYRPPQPDPRFRWPAPAPLEPGSGWVYGVFTPPRLYLEPAPGGGPLRFRFVPPSGSARAEADEPATFGLRLVRAEPVPSRFQVVGVAAGRKEAGAAGPLVLFADLASPPDQPRVFALAPGEVAPAKGLRLERVERVVREPARGGVEVAYIAEVRTGEDGPLRRLSSRATHTAGDPVLYFAATDTETPAELRGPGEGGVLEVGERRYRVDRIDPAADLVRVSRRHPQGGGRWTEEWRLSGGPRGPAPAPDESPVSPSTPGNPAPPAGGRSPDPS